MEVVIQFKRPNCPSIQIGDSIMVKLTHGWKFVIDLKKWWLSIKKYQIAKFAQTYNYVSCKSDNYGSSFFLLTNLAAEFFYLVKGRPKLMKVFVCFSRKYFCFWKKKVSTSLSRLTHFKNNVRENFVHHFSVSWCKK